jgi:hypothetical protein
MSIIGTCEICGEPVPEHQAAYPVSGWEALRQGGGANRIIGRHRDENRVAHAHCVERSARQERQGIHPDQGSLV